MFDILIFKNKLFNKEMEAVMKGVIKANLLLNKKYYINFMIFYPIAILIIALLVERSFDVFYLIVIEYFAMVGLYHINSRNNPIYLSMAISRAQLVLSNLIIFSVIYFGLKIIIILFLVSINYSNNFLELFINALPLMFCFCLLLSPYKYANVKKYDDSMSTFLLCGLLFFIFVMIGNESELYLILFYLLLLPISIVFHIKKSIKLLNTNEY